MADAPVSFYQLPISPYALPEATGNWETIHALTPRRTESIMGTIQQGHDAWICPGFREPRGSGLLPHIRPCAFGFLARCYRAGTHRRQRSTRYQRWTIPARTSGCTKEARNERRAVSLWTATIQCRVTRGSRTSLAVAGPRSLPL